MQTRRFRSFFPVRRALLPLIATGMVCAAIPVAPAHAEPLTARVLQMAAQDTDSSVRAFYETRSFKPLWISEDRVSPAGQALVDLVRSAKADAIKTKPLKAKDLARAIERAESGSPADLARAELALSRTFATYVKAMRTAPRAPMTYESVALEPIAPTAQAALEAAAAAPSLERYIADMGWMHPLYAGLRNALASGNYDGQMEALLRLNLARIRAIPAYSKGRHVLVDAANARLIMYKDGQAVDAMRVVVGKADNQTPMMAGFLRYAQVNPYWNIPPDLVQLRIAPNVLDRGMGYLQASGYQVLDSWDDDAKVMDPAKVDWHAVAAGKAEVRVRQLPGRDNFMGKVKFMFPNPQGIYLHDTPDRHLLVKDERQFSSGCVRLEDAPRLGKWLFGKPLPTKTKRPEQRVDLPEIVPVYLTYLTVSVAPGRGVTFAPDVYGRDSTQLAALARSK